MEFKAKEKYSVSDLISIMALLRGEGGCPWDREQDHLTIRKNLIEEAYEVVEAIDAGDPEMLREELGDLLLQVVFHSRISEEEGDFSIEEVADGICRKLIHRHPHIFSDVVVKDSGEVLENWDAIKKQEKGQKTASDTLHSVPKVLPALMRSRKVAKRAADHGFTYPDAQAAIADLEQELTELKQAVAQGSADAQQEELGDVLFSAANVSRFLDCDAEEALDAATVKFVRRFREMERLAAQQGCAVDDLSAAELDKLWKRAKEVFTKR